jgi:hypothetical protein
MIKYSVNSNREVGIGKFLSNYQLEKEIKLKDGRG